MECPKCGSPNMPGATQCLKCGQSLAQGTVEQKRPADFMPGTSNKDRGLAPSRTKYREPIFQNWSASLQRYLKNPIFRIILMALPSLIPGFGQWRMGYKKRGFFFCSMFVLSACIIPILMKTQGADLFTTLMWGTLVYSVIDAGQLAARRFKKVNEFAWNRVFISISCGSIAFSFVSILCWINGSWGGQVVYMTQDITLSHFKDGDAIFFQDYTPIRVTDQTNLDINCLRRRTRRPPIPLNPITGTLRQIRDGTLLFFFRFQALFLGDRQIQRGDWVRLGQSDLVGVILAKGDDHVLYNGKEFLINNIDFTQEFFFMMDFINAVILRVGHFEFTLEPYQYFVPYCHRFVHNTSNIFGTILDEDISQFASLCLSPPERRGWVKPHDSFKVLE